MNVPAADLPVPDLVLALANGRQVTPVWRNRIGGTTWLLGGEHATYVKVGPAHHEFEIASDIARLDWVSAYVTTPTVLGSGTTDGIAWLETAALSGWGAISGHFDPRTTSPEAMAAALGRALRSFHDAVPVEACPWTWSVEDRLAGAPLLTRARFAADPPLDPVVCHGDACNPNFILDDSLACTGYVDLGRLGVADRWADIALATMSLGWNFGPGLTAAFLDGYGTHLDASKLGYYQALWDAET